MTDVRVLPAHGLERYLFAEHLAAAELPAWFMLTPGVDAAVFDLWRRHRHIEEAAVDLLPHAQSLAAVHRELTERLVAIGTEGLADPTLAHIHPHDLLSALRTAAAITGAAPEALAGVLLLDGLVRRPSPTRHAELVRQLGLDRHTRFAPTQAGTAASEDP
jgi:hypothetical protein